jgi:hypothetical protein
LDARNADFGHRIISIGAIKTIERRKIPQLTVPKAAVCLWIFAMLSDSAAGTPEARSLQPSTAYAALVPDACSK